MEESILVQTLIGSKELPFYLRCLGSLLENSEQRIELLLHTDNTLSKSEKDLVFASFKDERISFCDPVESEQKTLDHLSGYPLSQKLRRESIWGIEFFDPIFAIPNDPISFYIDADILFLRPFSGLFDKSVVKGGALFIRDTQWDAYCIRPWHLLGIGIKPKIVQGITTALVCWDKRCIDWDYLEWFLASTHLQVIPEWILPTAQAGLASMCNAKTISSYQITNLYPNAHLTLDTFGVHLLGSYRKDWLRRLTSDHKNQNEKKTTIQARFEDCKKRYAFGYALNQVKRWCNTRLNYW